jgi:hypothetical protein
VTEQTGEIVRGYNLGPPSVDCLKADLARAVGTACAAALWSDARHSAGCDDAAPRLSFDELAGVADHLSREAGVAGVIGKSFHLRLRTYRLLSQQCKSNRGHQHDEPPDRTGRRR